VADFPAALLAAFTARPAACADMLEVVRWILIEVGGRKRKRFDGMMSASSSSLRLDPCNLEIGGSRYAKKRLTYQ
jgi:hypothetical protein